MSEALIARTYRVVSRQTNIILVQLYHVAYSSSNSRLQYC